MTTMTMLMLTLTCMLCYTPAHAFSPKPYRPYPSATSPTKYPAPDSTDDATQNPPSDMMPTLVPLGEPSPVVEESTEDEIDMVDDDASFDSLVTAGIIVLGLVLVVEGVKWCIARARGDW